MTPNPILLPSSTHHPSRVNIVEALDVFVARWSAEKLAISIGFPAAARMEIAIVVSELATNILKYGVRGWMVMERTHDETLGPGIEIIAEDQGPPLADLATAVRDGFGDRGPLDPTRQIGRGGIGAGLGAIIRLTDTFEYHASPTHKTFRTVRYLQRPTRTKVP